MLKMSKSRTIVLVGSLVLVVILLAGWFLLLSPRTSTASDLNTQRESVSAANILTATKIAELEQMEADIGSVKAEAEVLATRFPPTAEESELFRLVKKAAEEAGLDESNVSALTIAVPALAATDGSVGVPAAPAAPVEGEEADAEAPADAPVGATAPTSQLGSMTLDVTVSGSQSGIIAFIKALENMDRAYLINSITLGLGGEGAAGSTATINGNMYLLPALVDPTVEVPAEETVPLPGEPPVEGSTPVEGVPAP